MTLIKMPWEYKIFKSARTKHENDVTNLVDRLLIRTQEEGVVSASTENDVQLNEIISFRHKGFFCQIFKLEDAYVAMAGTETLKHNIRFQSEPQRTERLAGKQIMEYIEKFRNVKSNDNRVING